MAYNRRIIDDELDAVLPALTAVALEGARGVGKTATALQRARSVRRLDDPGQLALLLADPSRLSMDPPPVLVDEWQRLPQVWDVVRRAVDDGAPPSSFLLTGSAEPTSAPAHSGAGRIPTLRLRPLSLAERGVCSPTVSLAALLAGGRPRLRGRCDLGLGEYTDEVVSSGFPGIRNLPPRARRLQLDAYVQRLSRRDLDVDAVRTRSPATLMRWMRAYAAATSTTATFESIRMAAASSEGVAPTRAVVQPYRDALDRMFILDPLPAWQPTRNPFSRLAMPDKHHLVDPALAARLLNVGPEALLQGTGPTLIVRDGVLLGRLFESLVTQSVRIYARACEATAGHLRTKGGRQEVDLIVQQQRAIVAIEIKLATHVTDHDVRHLRWLADQLGSDVVDALVITTGPEAYRRDDGIGVVPAGLLGP